MIGLIFGETNFPIEILKKVKKSKKNYLIIDLTRSKKFIKDKNCHNVSIGQFGKIIKILKDNKCKKVLFAGKVKKPNLSKLRLDLKGIYYIPRIIRSSKLGDASTLKEIIKILNQERINTISSLTFNPELTLKKGNYSRIRPNREDKADINKAIKVLNRLGKYTFSQGAVVRKKKVVAIIPARKNSKRIPGKNYKKFKKKALKQQHYAKKFTRDKMTEKLGEILDMYLPKPVEDVDIKLPKLKKVNLPKLKKL